MGGVIYKIEGMSLAETPTEVLTEIIQKIAQSLKHVAMSQFREESKDFKVFIKDFSHGSMNFHVDTSGSLEGIVGFMSQAYNSKKPSDLPKRSYDATKQLVEIIKKQGGESLGVYNSAVDPLFQFRSEDEFPEYRPSPVVKLIQGEVIRVGKIYSISGEAEPLVKVRLLNGQKFQKKVEKVTGVLLGKHIFQWIDVKGWAKRDAESAEFEEFEILDFIPNRDVGESEQNYFDMRSNRSKYESFEGEEEFDDLMRSLD